MPRKISGINSGRRSIQPSPIIILSNTKKATDIVLTKLSSILLALKKEPTRRPKIKKKTNGIAATDATIMSSMLNNGIFSSG